MNVPSSMQALQMRGRGEFVLDRAGDARPGAARGPHSYGRGDDLHVRPVRPRGQSVQHRVSAGRRPRGRRAWSRRVGQSPETLQSARASPYIRLCRVATAGNVREGLGHLCGRMGHLGQRPRRSVRGVLRPARRPRAATAPLISPKLGTLLEPVADCFEAIALRRQHSRSRRVCGRRRTVREHHSSACVPRRRGD